MVEVLIYTKRRCVHCMRAKRRLHARGVAFRAMSAGDDVEAMREQLHQLFGRRTFPQIVIGATHIGGASELAALDKQGHLRQLLDPGVDGTSAGSRM